MPIFCESKLKTLFIIGITNLVLNIIICFGRTICFIVTGIIGSITSVLLIFGTYKQSNIAIVFWMILAISQCIAYIYYFVAFALFSNTNCAIEGTFLVFGLMFLVLLVIFVIGSVVFANKARKEIDAVTSMDFKPEKNYLSTPSHTTEPLSRVSTVIEMTDVKFTVGLKHLPINNL